MLFSNPDPVGQNGQCVKTAVEQNTVVWSVVNCMDVSTKGYVCQKRQNFDDIGKILISDCYIPFWKSMSILCDCFFLNLQSRSLIIIIQILLTDKNLAWNLWNIKYKFTIGKNLWFSGCYAMPSIELNTTLKNNVAIATVLIPSNSKNDPAAFCRDRCIKLQNQYFVLLETQTKCQCVPRVPLGGNCIIINLFFHFKKKIFARKKFW